MRRIIDIQLRGLMKRLEDRKIHVELTRSRRRTCSSRRATIRRTARGRSSGRFSAGCSIRWRMRVLEGDFREGDTRSRSTRRGGELQFEQGARPSPPDRQVARQRYDQSDGRSDVRQAAQSARTAAGRPASWRARTRSGLGDVVRARPAAAARARRRRSSSRLQAGETISYSEFKTAVRDGQVAGGHARRRSHPRHAQARAERQAADASRPSASTIPKLIEDLEAHGVKYTGEVDEPLAGRDPRLDHPARSSSSRSGASSSAAWAAPKAA